MLFKPEAFERLTDEPWNEDRVRKAIREIVADTDAALRGPKLLWRADDWDGWHGTSPMKNLYVGAAGVLWALDELRRRGHAESTLDLADLALRTVELFRVKPDLLKGMTLPTPRESSLLEGETGILLVACRLAPSIGLADELHARVRANVTNEAEEVMWGTPGTLIAARAMLEWTGERRWRDAWHESADALWSRRGADGLWTQRLYDQEFRSLTPPHGLVGNVQALLPLLDDTRRDVLLRDTAAVLERTAVVEDGLANWPPRDRRELAGPDRQIRVQVVCRKPWDRHRGIRVPGRRAAAGGSRASLAHGTSGSREGPVDLPRHGRPRLRVPEGLCAHGR
jgi:hypothetical protein